MTDIGLFVIGLIVFLLLLTGLVLTMVEFRRMTERPDLYKGAELSSRAASHRDDAT